MRKNIFFKPVIAAALAAVLMSGCGKNTENTAETAKEAAKEPASSEASESGGTDAAETPAGETDAAAETYADQPEENAGKPGTPPEKPEGGPDGAPPEGRPGGAPPSGAPGEKGDPGGMPGGPGGGASKPESYEAAESFSKDTETSGRTYSSQGKDENAILAEGGNVVISDASISRTSGNSTGGDSASFYGVGAAALCTGGTLRISGSTITTDSAGGAGAFAYGDGVIYISDTAIETKQDTSGGIHAAGGGTLYADKVTAVTSGASSAAIRSDRGGGTMVVTGGEYTSNGSGSPAVYCTADIMVSNAKLSATGAEAVCIEGKNSLKLTDCDLSGNMPDDEQNDNTWTVIVYQSMSGDSEVGCGSFTMKGGTLTSANGGLFYTTNTESEITLDHVRISSADTDGFLLQCTGNTNARGWGKAGENGAKCTFTANNQTLEGDVIWDSISTLDMKLMEGSALAGAFIDNESWTGSENAEEPAGEGHASLTVDQSSIWIVTGDSVLTTLENKGMVTDTSGRTVRIVGTDGTVYEEGDSSITVTVSEYKE